MDHHTTIHGGPMEPATNTRTLTAADHAAVTQITSAPLHNPCQCRDAGAWPLAAAPQYASAQRYLLDRLPVAVPDGGDVPLTASLAMAILRAGAAPRDGDELLALALDIWPTLDQHRAQRRDREYLAGRARLETAVHVGTLVAAGHLAALVVAERARARMDDDLDAMIDAVLTVLWLPGGSSAGPGRARRAGLALDRYASGTNAYRVRGLPSLATAAYQPPGGRLEAHLTALIREAAGESDPDGLARAWGLLLLA